MNKAKWIDPEDQKPELGQRVIVALRFSTGYRWFTIAEYIHCMSVRYDDWPDLDYDDIDGTGYVPEGWYEYLIETEQNLSISGQVLGWMALPDFPVADGQIKKRDEAIANIKAGLREKLDARKEVGG